MDFGFMSLESLVGPADTAIGAHNPSPSSPSLKLGSGFFKNERSGNGKEEEDDDDAYGGGGNSNWRAPKAAKTTASRSGLLFHGGEAVKQEQTLISFSSGGKSERNGYTGQSLAFPYCPTMDSSSSSPWNSRAIVSGYGSASSNQAMHAPFNGGRGPFTPSQWIELEHQALIYKYITSNVAVPSNLLLPIKKSINPFAFSAPSFPGNSFGWGGYHVGFADTSDPEPGRCRRTDGKKWRCSKDAVVDQKYCERHINRGRHRSRKPVEAKATPAPAPTPVVTGASPRPALANRPKPEPPAFGLAHPESLQQFADGWTQLSMSIPEPAPQKTWRPMSWELGGPLGEALTSTMPVNLSPTGVLQKSTLSNNSSCGSSPRAERF